MGSPRACSCNFGRVRLRTRYHSISNNWKCISPNAKAHRYPNELNTSLHLYMVQEIWRPVLERNQFMQRMIRGESSTEELGLPFMLFSTLSIWVAELSVTDPRDKLYAILGIFGGAARSLYT